MESKLAAYRLRKRRKEIIDTIKSRLIKMIPFRNDPAEESKKVSCVVDVPSQSSDSDQEEPEPVSEEESVHELTDDLSLPQNKWLRYTYYIVYFLFWVTCYTIAIELKFGVVYLIISAIFAIYYNTRTGPKRKGEISAYSVFNKNCESIDGTLKAEQFEREIRFGYASVR